MTITSTLRALDATRGAVRMEEVYETDIDDLWQACTTPDRLARWIARVDGKPGVGQTVHVTFTSSWSGTARIDVCEAPHHLLLTCEPGATDETQVEVWLTAEGSRTRLVVEERGLELAHLHVHGAGWQAHLEDLARSLATREGVHPEGWSPQAPAAAWHARWSELTPSYLPAAGS